MKYIIMPLVYITMSKQHDIAEDIQLIRLTLSGDETAFAKLIEKYKNILFNLIYRMTGNRQEAEDILQDVFVKAFRSLQSFKITGNFFSWIYTIAVNHARNHEKRKKIIRFFSLHAVHEEEEHAYGDMKDYSPGPDRLAEQQEESRKVNRLIAQLPFKYREIFLLRHMEEFSYQEIADMTGLPLGTVEVRLHRAHEKLKKEYKKYFQEQ